MRCSWQVFTLEKYHTTPMKSFLMKGHIKVKALHKQIYRVNEYKLWLTLPHLRLLNFAPNCLVFCLKLYITKINAICKRFLCTKFSFLIPIIFCLVNFQITTCNQNQLYKLDANLCNLCNKILKYSCDFLSCIIELWSARLSQHKNVHIISLTDARALHSDSRNHTKDGAILVEMILLVKNLLTVIATDFALQIIVSIIDNAIRITFDHTCYSSAFYPPSAFSHPRFILHPHFLIRILSSAIRIRIRIRVSSLPCFAMRIQACWYLLTIRKSMR